MDHVYKWKVLLLRHDTHAKERNGFGVEGENITHRNEDPSCLINDITKRQKHLINSMKIKGSVNIRSSGENATSYTSVPPEIRDLSLQYYAASRHAK